MNGLIFVLALAQPGPNVVVILTDDQGWGDLSLNGNRNLSTPNIDSLGRDGASFERFYVCPVCSPTRAEFLTGRYHPRGGVRDVSRGGERLDLAERTIADAFKAAGYATGAFGKWHNGTQYPYHPRGRGFDEFYGFTSGHWGDYFDPDLLDHDGRLVRGKGYIVDDVTDRAAAFIERHRAGRFFCYVAYNVPHTPFQVPDRYFGKFKSAPLPMPAAPGEREDPEATRAALAMVECVDDNVGRLLKKLDELGVARNTVVVFFHDNGPNLPRWNGGMKGRKGSTDEGGVRSPLLVRWPERIKPGTRVTPIAGAIDLLPTLADLARVPAPREKPLDGISLAPLLLGATVEPPDRVIFSHWGGRVSARTQRFRLDAAGKLFDLDADPGQTRDVAAEQPDARRRLQEAVDRWRAELLAGLKPDERPFPVGYRELPATQLPARDATPRGGVRRSAAAPNCSYLTNWTRPDDAVTWDIQVVTGGVYEVVLYYTCPPDDVGSTIELSFNGARLEGRVTEAHDPPLRAAERDRLPRRGESDLKDFKPMTLGRMALAPGRGPLTLRAPAVPGRRVMDLRMIVLTLVD
jgi:arylsulfatase A-like enzyme